jgi:autotransporter-associated beta strand protein
LTTGTITLDASGVTSADTINYSNASSLTAVSNNTGTRNIVLAGSNTGNNTFNGVITNNSGTGGKAALTKNGVGTWVLTNANTYTGATTVSQGTLKLGVDNALSDNSNVVIGTGTLDADTRTDSAGTLDVTGSAVIHLGSGAALAFADSELVDWTGGTLNVTGTLGATSLRFGTDNTGLSVAQLAVISVNGSGLGTCTLDASGYLVAGSSDPYDTWSGSAPFDADANNDGVDNGLAWLLGAADKDANALGLLPVVTQSSGNLVLNFTCLKVAGRGTAVLKLQYSNDLGISDLWTSHEVVVPDAAGTVGSVAFTIPSVNADPTLVNLQATIPASAALPGTKLFGRLEAVKP